MDFVVTIRYHHQTDSNKCITKSTTKCAGLFLIFKTPLWVMGLKLNVMLYLCVIETNQIETKSQKICRSFYFTVVLGTFFMNKFDLYTHIFHGYFTGNENNSTQMDPSPVSRYEKDFNNCIRFFKWKYMACSEAQNYLTQNVKTLFRLISTGFFLSQQAKSLITYAYKIINISCHATLLKGLNYQVYVSP